MKELLGYAYLLGMDLEVARMEEFNRRYDLFSSEPFLHVVFLEQKQELYGRSAN